MVAYARLYGAAAVRLDDGRHLPLTPQRRLQVLAVLACHDTPVTRETLAALFWPDRDAESARNNLRKVLHELRRLDVTDIDDGADGLLWRGGSDRAELARACRERRWREAADLGAATALDGLCDSATPGPFADWAAAQRGELVAQWRGAVLQALGETDASQALAWAEALLAADPLDDDAMAAAWRAATALQRLDHADALWRRYSRAFADAAGTAPPQALRQLVEHGPPARWALDPMVGRRAEWQALDALLDRAALVTLFGPGGVGKSRLARYAVEQRAARHAGGAVFVPLDDLDAPGALLPRLAAALGEPLAPTETSIDALARRLRSRSLLVVLDGFEAVIDAADQVQALRASAPGLRLLVTSRERLDVPGEQLLPLPALGLPEAHASADAALQSDAVQLFVARAAAVAPGFQLVDQLQAVADICRQVDGLPLAIELAAAWVRVMPPAAIAQELSGSLALLADGGSSHVGLRAVFERSWQMLTAGERQALVAIGVFRGGFTREAALAVAGVELPQLAALADKSMLRSVAQGRFELHAALAGFVRERLALLPDHDALLDRHASWFLDQLVHPAPPSQRAAWLAAEHDNLLQAWSRAIEEADVPRLEATLPLLPVTRLFGGRLADAERWFDRAARRLAAHAGTAAWLRAFQAWLLLWLGCPDAAQQLATQALAVLRAEGHDAGQVMALRTLGHAARRRGQCDQAVACFDQALALARTAGRTKDESALLDALAMGLNLLGRYAEARQAIAQAMVLNEATGDDMQRLYNQFNRSQSHSFEDDAPAALPWCQGALASALRIPFPFFVPYTRAECAAVHLALGQPDLARREAEQALHEARATGDAAPQVGALAVLAQLHADAGDADGATRCVVSAARLALDPGPAALGAVLLPVAAQLWSDDPRRGGAALLTRPEVPAHLRRRATAFVAAPAEAAAGWPVTLAGWLAELAARGAPDHAA